MAFKDLTDFLSPNLELPWQGRVFIVPPPSREVGLILAALSTQSMVASIAVGGACPTCHRSDIPEVEGRQKTLLESAQDKDLGELSLGSAYQEMIDAGVPGPDLELFELYAFYYWVYGEVSADTWLVEFRGKKHGVDDPKAQTPLTNGHGTGSGSQSVKMKTASRSTRTTASRKK